MSSHDDSPLSSYEEQNKNSKNLHSRACEVMPGGDTRSVTYTNPYPTYIESASGFEMTTADNRTVIDYLNNYTQAIHGHAPEQVIDVITHRIREGNGVGSPTEDAIELAEHLVDRFPSLEQVRFSNSGTEATMNALRAAMTFTGNEKIVKAKGGYHGTHDTVEISISDNGREHVGIPLDVEHRVLSVPFNDEEELKEVLENNGNDLACFIVEPVLGAAGMIPAEQEYLETARDITEDQDVLLIFDEVMSSRISMGGAQQTYDVTPDLTALGKYIGGGLPVGAFGGRQDVMGVYHPTEGVATHSGTFNGNPATMAGGVTTLEMLDHDTIKQINNLGEQLRSRVTEVADDYSVPVQVTGAGSLFHIHFTDGPVVDAATAGSSLEEKDDNKFGHEFYLAMRREGIFMAPRGMGNISTPMSHSEVDFFVEGFDSALNSLEQRLSSQ